MLVSPEHVKEFVYSGRSKFMVINKDNGVKMALALSWENVYAYENANFKSFRWSVGRVRNNVFNTFTPKVRNTPLESVLSRFFGNYLLNPSNYPSVEIHTTHCGRCGRILRKESLTGLGPSCRKKNEI